MLILFIIELMIDDLYNIYQAWVNDTLTTDKAITYNFTKPL